MEGTPRGLDAEEIERFIADDPAVEGIHHVHVWNIASDMPALSAHVVISGERTTLHEAQVEGDRIRARVLERFGIEHTTLELECHACEHGPGSHAALRTRRTLLVAASRSSRWRARLRRRSAP